MKESFDWKGLVSLVIDSFKSLIETALFLFYVIVSISLAYKHEEELAPILIAVFVIYTIIHVTLALKEDFRQCKKKKDKSV